MKEIDFIPDWYKADCRRKERYVRQYTLIGTLVAVTMLWSFMMGRYINHAAAEVQEVDTAIRNKMPWIDEATLLEQDIAAMQAEIKTLRSISPRTNLSAVIGEISYLMQDNIILKNLSFVQEEIAADTQPAEPKKGTVVRVDIKDRTEQKAELTGQAVRMKVVLSGIAAKPADAAGLISRLEQSSYFEDTGLIVSRPGKVNDKNVTEFEICCYVADYQILDQGVG
jgi:hypothetical protein